MPINRTRSQSTSASQSPNIFSGFQNWRRRRPSNSLPSSPLVPSTSSNTNTTTNTNINNNSNINSINNNNNTTTLVSTNHLMRSTSISDIPYQSSQPIYQSSTDNNNVDNNNSSSNTNTNNDSTETNPNNVHIRLVPNVNMSNRCFIFDVIERNLNPSTVLKIGRYSERNVMNDRISFKSKVVSRTHAELWVDENNKLFIKDVGSSSGTFVNRIRLSPSNVESLPSEVKDGDLIQLGVDYQGGLEPMYRSVKIRLELNRQTSHSYSRQAFQQLRQHIMGSANSTIPLSSSAGTISNTPPTHHHLISSEHSTPHNIRTIVNDSSIITEELGLTREDTKYNDEKKDEESSLSTSLQHKLAMAVSSGAVSEQPHLLTHDIQECCICLYAIAPFQALFVSPCSHIFHFKCLRPLLTQNYPAFSCPICRSYFDLEASVAIEVSEVEEALGLIKAAATTTTSSSSSSTTQPVIKKSTTSSNIPATITEDRVSEDSESSSSSSSSASDGVEIGVRIPTSSSTTQPIESNTKMIHTQTTSSTLAQSSSNQLITTNNNNDHNNDEQNNDNDVHQQQQNNHMNIPNISSTGMMENPLLSTTLVEHANLQEN